MSPIRNEQNSTFLDRSSLVGEWLLDGSGNDTSGNGNNGTATNVPWVGAERGYVSEVGSFNGSSSKVNISANLYPGTEFETSVFQKFNALPSLGTVMYFYSHRVDFGNGNAAYLFNDGGTYKLVYSNYFTSGNVILSYNFTPTVGEYYLFSFCSTSNGMKIYINNVEVASNSNTGTLRTSSNDLGIGAYSTGGGWLNGEIGLFRIYNTNQNTTQRTTLYQEGLRKFGPFNAQQHPELLENLKVYASFLGDGLIDLENSVSLTNSGTTATTNRLGQANNSRLIGSGDSIGMDNISNISTGTILFGFTPSANIDNTINGLIRLTSSNVGGANTGDFSTYWLTSGQFNLDMEGTTNLAFTETLNADTYYLLGISWASGSRQICLNGVSKATDTITDTAFSTTGGVTTRLVDTNSATNCNLAMDFVMIYDGEKLSEAKQKEIYEITSKKDVFNFPRYSLPNLNEGKVLHIDGTNNGTTYYDQSGNGNHGTQSGGVTTSQLGLNKVMTFDGVDDSINLGTGDIGVGGSFSFICKYKPTSNITAQQYQILINDWTGGKANFYIYTSLVNNGILTCLSGNGASLADSTSLTYSLINGEEHHIAYIRNGTTKKLYINAVEVDSFTGGYTGGVTTNSKRIGGDIAGTLNLNGSLIEPEIYNRVLTPEEIQQDFTSNFIPN